MNRCQTPRFIAFSPGTCLLMVLTACLLGLVGCAKHPEARDGARPSVNRASSGEDVPGVPDGGYAPPEPPQKARDDRDLPQPDRSTPETTYVPITSGAQLMFLYQAYSGLPADPEKTAIAVSREYAGTTDTFRRKDLLAALRPKLDASRAEAKSHPYVRWDQEWTHVGHYDFARKGFPILDPMLQEGGSGYMADVRGYGIDFTNGPSVAFVPVADEGRAREIEALLQKTNFPIRFYAFVQSANEVGEPRVHAKVVKLQVLDRQGRVLLENSATE